jgi:tetratricopeptide (TPR) repeat protein
MAAIGAGLMIYNALRFGNSLDFGQRYQLPLVVHQQFSLRYLWINFRVGFLDPARWSGRFPFVHDIAEPALPPGYWQLDHAFGVLSNIPVVWLALAAPLAWRRGAEEGASKLRWFMGAVALLFGVCALTLGLHDSMCLRYEMEYATPLLLLAVVGVFAVERAPAGRPAWRWAARCGWVLLLAFSVAFNLLASVALHATKHTKFGIALQQKGRVDEAIAEDRKALEMQPDDPLVHNNLGYSLVQKGKMDEGMAQYEKALQLNPGFALAHYNLGNAFLKKGNLDGAIAQFQKAQQINPGTPLAHNNLGIALAQENRMDEAMAQFQEALEIDPDSLDARQNLGSVLLQKGRVDEAIAQYQKALEIKPDIAEAHHNLGKALLQKGRVDEAIAHFQRALQLNPGDALVHYILGNALMEKGTMDDAMTQYQEALQINPDSALVHNNLGIVLAKKGKVDEAITQFQKALEINPDIPDAHQNLGNAFLQKGRTDEAITQYQRLLQLRPDAADTHQILGDALAQQGRVDEAIAQYQKALESKPADPTAQNALAWLLATAPAASSRNGAKALELARQASLLTGGENPTVLHTLAAACAEAGRFAEAVETAQHALRLAEAQSNTALAAALQSELMLYQAGSPLHEPQR